MTAKVITSTAFGLLLPWLYFFVTETYSMDLYYNGVLIKEAGQASEVELFIESYGWQKSLMLYLQSFLICFFVAFSICFANEIIERKLKSKNL